MASSAAPRGLTEIRARWSAERTLVANRALEKGQLAELGLASHNGRTDLRGLVVSVMIKRRRLKAVDFSSTSWPLPAQLSFCELSDCLFDEAEVGANLDYAFFNCSFRKAKMLRVVLRGQFEDCDFSAANLGDAGASEVKFVRCRFNGANLKRAHFLRCTFSACEFSDARFGEGSLAGSKLEGSPIDRSALANTILERTVIG